MVMELKTAIENIKNIYLTETTLEYLMDFERVLDNVDMYAYPNWSKGELVAGPEFEKYFVTCTFMWPRKNMPDPNGASRLLMYGCKVFYQKDDLVYPVKIESPDDYRDDGSRKARLAKMPIWLVKIVMPKKLMYDIQQGSVEIEGETIDLEDIESAYEENLDQEGIVNNDEE